MIRASRIFPLFEVAKETDLLDPGIPPPPLYLERASCRPPSPSSRRRSPCSPSRKELITDGRYAEWAPARVSLISLRSTAWSSTLSECGREPEVYQADARLGPRSRWTSSGRRA